MKTSQVYLMSCLLALLLPQALLAQQVDVTAELINESLETFFLNDFDINRPATGPPFFSVRLTNNTSAPAATTLRMQVRTEDRGELLDAETGCFVIPAGGFLVLTSNRLFTNSGPYRFETSSVSNAVDDLLADILRTGKLPTDVYHFDLSTEVAGQCGEPGIFSDADGFDIRVTNPNRLDLITPGGPVGRLADCPTVYTNLPQFRWESNFTKFRFLAARLRAGEDPESALNQEPRLARLFILSSAGALSDLAGLGFPGRGEVLTTTSFQYPPSGESLILGPGDIIVWRVIALVETSAGVREDESEIFCFKIRDLEQLGSGREQYDFILRNLLGNDFSLLFGENGEFRGYRPTGMRLDSQPVTPAELIPNLEQMRQNYKGYRVE